MVYHSKNKILYDDFREELHKSYPDKSMNDRFFFENHIQKYATKLDKIINNILSKIDMDNILFWGFSIKMDAWIAAAIIAKKIKKLKPDVPIIIGGINTKKTAEAFLNNFSQFDMAVWGEGEETIIQIAEFLKNQDSGFSNIVNLAYRNKDKVHCSNKVKRNYANLSLPDIYPDYADFFSQQKALKLNTGNIIPVEGGRGCHWNKCKFCYLNEDYRYRLKTVKKICLEIRFMIKKYKVYDFEFLDNDFLGLDAQSSNELLDGLLNIKNDFPKFRIVTVEVITKGLTCGIIKKMFDAGVIYAQIGYESTSDKLLNKIRKKNSFASNLFYVKTSMRYKVPLNSVNVLLNMPDETEKDIDEAINNLTFLRFFLHPYHFRHRLFPVMVNSSSKYYKKIQQEKDLWIVSNISYNFLKNFIKEEYYWDILTFSKQEVHEKWNDFKQREKYYLDNRHTYSVKNEKDNFVYLEYCNGKKICELNAKHNSLDFQILHHTNNQVVSLDELKIILNINPLSESFTEEEIIVSIDLLYQKYLIYHSPDYTEIVSVINML
ncbi:hypothetical protein FACS1894178_6380 [Bacteroidia bacterium]|nr:hypothetical protein FACS1894178_6380 [Bacteroidia bacterium]